MNSGKNKKKTIIIITIITIFVAILLSCILIKTIKRKRIEAKINQEKEYEKFKENLGKEVKGYTFSEETSKEIKDIKWQLFYVGKIDESDESEEERIYLISKECISNKLLPKQQFSKYKGSEAISQNLQKYNKDYFSKYKSTLPNMKATAYMMDTSIWNKFKGQEGEYVIGGPSIELLFKAYNEHKGLTGNKAYTAQAIDKIGYKVSHNGGTSYDYYISNAVTVDDTPYSIYDSKQYTGYWISSPSAIAEEGVCCVDEYGQIINAPYNDKNYGYRPIVCLKSGVKLKEITEDNEVILKIVPSSVN